MCGRFELHTPLSVIASITGAIMRGADPGPRYNISPSTLVPVVRMENGIRTLDSVAWGLVPQWAKDATIGSRLINARGETVAIKPAYRNAFQSRRCLIPVDGFYEWQKQSGHRVPYLIRMRRDEPFFMAGLWERWMQPDRAAHDSCTIITTEANGLIKDIHDRMPVILSHESWSSWLGEQRISSAELQALLVPFPADEMDAYPVSSRVNSPKNDDPECIARLMP